MRGIPGKLAMGRRHGPLDYDGRMRCTGGLQPHLGFALLGHRDDITHLEPSDEGTEPQVGMRTWLPCSLSPAAQETEQSTALKTKARLPPGSLREESSLEQLF